MDYFSKLTYINHNTFRILPGKEFTTKDLIKQDFKSTSDERFWFQFNYRRYSIKFIFAKEFFSALLLVVAFQLVNFKYIQLFDREEFQTLNYNDQYDYVETDLIGK
jgi:hypothetical protein